MISSVAIVDADNQVSIFLRWLWWLVNLTCSCDVALTIYNDRVLSEDFLRFFRLPVEAVVTSSVLNLSLVYDKGLTRSNSINLLTLHLFELQLLKMTLHLRFKLRLYRAGSLHRNLLRFKYVTNLSGHDILRHHAPIHLLALFYLIL